MSSLKCEHVGCKSISTFNYDHHNIAKFCSKHKLENMIQISFVGQKWTKQEDEKLLEEIKLNLDYDEIAKIHKRTLIGIKKRLEIIAYDMYFDEISMDEITLKTKISEEQINIIIKEKQQKYEKKNNINDYTKKQKKVNKIADNNVIETDIIEIKKQLENINTNIENIFNLLKTFSVYEKI